MSWFDDDDDWGWLGKVGDWFTSGDTDYSGITKGSEQWNMLKEQDSGLGTGLGQLGKGLYSAYQQDKARDRYLSRFAPMQQAYGKSLEEIQRLLDPATAQAGIQKEFDRRAGMLMPYLKQGAARRGLGDSSIFEKQLTDRLMGDVLPEAEQAYYARPTQLMRQLEGYGGLFGQQPMMQPLYRAAERDPYMGFLSSYLEDV